MTEQKEGSDMSDLVEVEDRGAVRIIAINRPEARNAISTPVLLKLKKAFKEAAKATHLRAVVLTGRGGAFSFGFLLLVFVLFGLFSQGVVFFPETQPALVNISIETPIGSSLDVTDAVAREVEARVDQIPGRGDIEFIVASIGSSDNPFDFGGAGTPMIRSAAIPQAAELLIV